jgi:hypothetical protein
MTTLPPIELILRYHSEPDCACALYAAFWPDGELFALLGIPEIWLDLAPFLAARILLEQGYNVAREFILRLEGADYELMRAPLGRVAATPVLSSEPVTRPAHAFIAEVRHD